MNIVVYDVAAISGGGVTILKQYIEKAQKDKGNQWWFILSLSGYEKYETDNVHVLYQKELDVGGLRRWYRRFIFESRKLSDIVAKLQPDRVLSLQNMMMPKAKCPQTIYLHQSLQFAPVRFSVFKTEERAFAIRQSVICHLIRKSLQKADEVIVQTAWMKAATARWANIAEEKIRIEWPSKPEYADCKDRRVLRNRRVFFYPAGGMVYKNHRIIIEACKLLKKDGIHDYHVEFTLDPEENAYVKMLYDEVQREHLPIRFIGYQNQAEMNAKYAENALLFPSYIETFGLPLQEARTFGASIIASDCEFAHEVLDGYDRCQFVAWDSVEGWARAIKKSMN